MYTCAKCGKALTYSEVYLIDGKNIIPNRRCKPCYTADTKPKEGTDLLAEKIVEEVSKQAPPTFEPGKVEESAKAKSDKKTEIDSFEEVTPSEPEPKGKRDTTTEEKEG